MNRTDRQRLEDALRHVDHALERWSSLRTSCLTDRISRQALLYDLIVVGTTFSAIPDAVRNVAPEIAWKAIVRTRNRFVHVYWNEDDAFMTTILTAELPRLRIQLTALLKSLGTEQ